MRVGPSKPLEYAQEILSTSAELNQSALGLSASCFWLAADEINAAAVCLAAGIACIARDVVNVSDTLSALGLDPASNGANPKSWSISVASSRAVNTLFLDKPASSDCRVE